MYKGCLEYQGISTEEERATRSDWRSHLEDSGIYRPRFSYLDFNWSRHYLSQLATA